MLSQNIRHGKYIVELKPKYSDFKAVQVPQFGAYGARDMDSAPFCLGWSFVTEPFVMISEPHTHDFDQFLHFFNGDSLHLAEFPAEVEFTLGEELETHVITGPTVIHVPAGVLHGPLEFKKVDAPVVFMNVALTPEYFKPGEHPK